MVAEICFFEWTYVAAGSNVACMIDLLSWWSSYLLEVLIISISCLIVFFNSSTIQHTLVVLNLPNLHELWTLNFEYELWYRRQNKNQKMWETCNELMKENDRFQGLLFRKDFRLLNLLWVGLVRFLFGLPTLFNKIEVLDMVSLVDIFGKILL